MQSLKSRAELKMGLKKNDIILKVSNNADVFYYYTVLEVKDNYQYVIQRCHKSKAALVEDSKPVLICLDDFSKFGVRSQNTITKLDYLMDWNGLAQVTRLHIDMSLDTGDREAFLKEVELLRLIESQEKRIQENKKLVAN